MKKLSLVSALLILTVNSRVEAQDICFSPAKEPISSCQIMIITEMKKATGSLKIAVFDFTDKTILDELKILTTRNIKINIILDSRQAKGRHSLSRSLLENKAFNVKTIKGSKGGIMHHKYVIIDDKTVITGSYNWSKNALSHNDENAVKITQPEIVNEYINNFNNLF